MTEQELEHLPAVQLFNEAFELKEAGRLEEAMRVWQQGDEAARGTRYPRPEIRSYVLMVRSNTLGTIQRRLQRFEESRRAYDEALAVAAGFYAATAQLRLDPPWYEPPAELPGREPGESLDFVTRMLAHVYYNKAQVELNLGSSGEWTRYLVYALDVSLQGAKDPDLASMVRLICEVAARGMESWVFLSLFAGHLARRLVLSTPSLSELAATSAFRTADRSLREALTRQVLTGEDWRTLVVSGLGFLGGELAPLDQFIDIVTPDVDTRFTPSILQALQDDSVAYAEVRLLVTAALNAGLVHEELVPCMLRLADHAYGMGMPEETIFLLEAMPVDQVALLPFESRAVRANLLANAYSDTGHSPLAVTIYQDLLNELNDPSQRSESAIVLSNLADDSLLAGDARRAYDLARQGLDGLEPDDRSPARGLLLLNLGAAAFTLGDHQLARTTFEEAIRLGRELPTQEPFFHKALHNLGIMIFVEDQPRAEALLDEAVYQSGYLGHFQDQARYLFGRARLLDLAGRVTNAVTILRAAIDAARRSEDRELQMLIIAALAGLYFEQDDHTSARTYYQEALDMACALGHWRAEAFCLGNLALVYSHLGQDSAADQAWNDQAALAQKHGDETFLLDWLNNRATNAFGRRDLPTAILYADQALTLGEASSNHRVAAWSLMIIGNVALGRGRSREAVTFQEAALQELENVDDVRLTMKVHGFLGLAYGELSEMDLAVRHLNAAINEAQRLGQATEAFSWAYQLADLEETRGDASKALDNYRLALDYLDEVRREREPLAELAGPIGTLPDPYRVYDRAALLALRLARPSQAFTVVERGRSRQFLSLLGQRRPGPAPRAMDRPWNRGLGRFPLPENQLSGEAAIFSAELRRAEQQASRLLSEQLIAQSGSEAAEALLRLAAPIAYDQLQQCLLNV
jgi:tetratricopeptide (TPR) repeat protein